ncbi:MAG: hypothetical protein ACRC92_26985 [Peptostreptococcaceae bacterium]
MKYMIKRLCILATVIGLLYSPTYAVVNGINSTFIGFNRVNRITGVKESNEFINTSFIVSYEIIPDESIESNPEFLKMKQSVEKDNVQRLVVLTLIIGNKTETLLGYISIDKELLADDLPGKVLTSRW